MGRGVAPHGQKFVAAGNLKVYYVHYLETGGYLEDDCRGLQDY